MKRKVYSELLTWKKHNTSQSLLVKGARQIGKTFIIKQFGENEFKNLLYINFEDQLDIRNAFDTMGSPEDAVKYLQTYGISKGIFNIEFETLIFMDEIQLSTRAFSLLKPLTEMNRFRIIVSGSLLGINLGGESLNPGPTVKNIEMYPMDFEEFLWAKHGEAIISILDEIKSSSLEGNIIEESYHNLLNGDIKDYVIVGGMPQVVLSYISKHDLGDVFLIQSSILELYRSDIQQYQTNVSNRIKTLKCFDSIPRQFSKENHSFIYSEVETGKTARQFGNALEWLERTGNVRKCHNVDNLKGSLIDGKGRSFKLYMNDIGLLVNMLGKDYVYKIQNDELGMFKGALYEQLLAQELYSKGEHLYYMKFKQYEIDFLIQHEGKVFPVECKSGGNTNSKSLKSYVNKYSPEKAYKVSMNNINLSNKVIKAIPHYVFALLMFEEVAGI